MKINNIALVSRSYTKPGLISRFLRFPPLAFKYLANSAPEYNYTIWDENKKKLILTELLKADIVAATVMTVQATQTYELTDWLMTERKHLGSTLPLIVLGGFHVSARPEEAKKHADAVVIGEGDDLWPRLIEDAENDRLKPFYKSDDPVELSKTLPFHPKIRHFFKDYPFFCNSLQLGRGCKYRCEYCSVPIFIGGKCRFTPVNKVVEEIKQIIKEDRIGLPRKILGFFNPELKKTFVVFLDDNIFMDNLRAKQLFRALIPWNILWVSQAAIDIAKDEETLKLAAESGCRGLFIGFESIDKFILKEIGKKQNDPEFYEEAVGKLHDHDIAVVGAFIFQDSPNKDIFRQTVEFTKKIKLDLAQFTIITPLPGTPFRKRLEEEGQIISQNWSDHNFGQVTFRTRNITAEELEKKERGAWKEFYSLNSILERMPPTDPRWWFSLRNSPENAWIRLAAYFFINLGFKCQIRKSLAYHVTHIKKPKN